MPYTIPPEVRVAYHRYRYAEGLSQKDSARAAGVSKAWAGREDAKVRADPSLNRAQNWVKPKQVPRLRGGAAEMKLVEAALDIPPLTQDELSADALRQLDDFHYFCLVQFGVLATPWRRAAFARLWHWFNTDEKEYLVINAPPGSGKSQLATHDFPMYLTVLDRRLRGLIGSASDKLATPYTRKLRTTMERTYPVQVSDVDKRFGLAVDAKTVLKADFGRFRPDNPSMLWQAHQFQVELIGGQDTGEKEPTWQAYGRGAEVLGNRNNFITWDDLVTKKSMRETTTADFVEWFEDEAETRLEPGGLFVLCGQRLGEDLYRNRLDVEVLDLDDDGNEVTYRQYHHIVFPAHSDDNCTGVHTRDAAPAEFDFDTGELVPGSGCLLEPRRLRWEELRRIRKNNPRKYEVVYQQNDFAEGDRLVPHMWIYGGEDSSGEMFPGCCDDQRGRLQIPDSLDPHTISVGSVDPSSSKNWSVQWWLNEPTFDVDHLLDLYKGTLTAGELLSFNPKDSKFYGMMHDWQLRSIELGRPITAWVVEANAAQRYLLQHRFVDQWQARFGVRIIAHHTHSHNKLDPEHGFWGMRNQYRWGKVRLPMLAGSNFDSLTLIDEAKRWTGERRGGRHGDDALMAQWIYRVNLPNIVPTDTARRGRRTPAADRAPSWMY